MNIPEYVKFKARNPKFDAEAELLTRLTNHRIHKLFESAILDLPPTPPTEKNAPTPSDFSEKNRDQRVVGG